ncbi:MAG: AAA family ATPase [Rhodospirillales bacterium]
MNLDAWLKRSGPHLVIIAGPNGSGKTTLTRRLIQEDVIKAMHPINADDIAASLRVGKTENSEAAIALHAAIQADAALDKRIDAGDDVLIETVLSSNKYRERVSRALSAGYVFTLIYIYTDDASINVDRVSQRVHEGGHGVPTDKVIARYHKSINQVSDYYFSAASLSVFFNNTGLKPLLTLIGRSGDVYRLYEGWEDDPVVSSVIHARQKSVSPLVFRLPEPVPRS